MTSTFSACGARTAALALAAGFAFSTAALAGDNPLGGGIGPDVIVGDLPNTSNYGNIGGIRAYSVGTTSCNIGTEGLLWISSTKEHPVIAQNMYRLHDGRFEQLGMSWLKHGFFALQQSLCATCQPGGGASLLGVGCSDPYSSGLNGSQGRLGPRFEVNAHTGDFTFPFSNPQGSTGNAVFKRLQVKEDMLRLPGARHFVEGHYIAADDAMAGNGNNNASYREVNVNSSFSLSVTGSTVREQPAIMAWEAIDPEVDTQIVDIDGDGRLYVASRVYDNGNGTFDYEYAIFNLNSHRSVGSVSVPTGGAAISGERFYGPEYHSGEPYDNTPWAITTSGSEITWATDAFDVEPDAYALRWSTLFNYSFTADSAPTDGTMSLGLHRPDAFGGFGSVDVTVPVPTSTACEGDYNGDGVVTIFDVVDFVTVWNTGTTAGDYNGDGSVNINDVVAFITVWNNGCP
jgi:hypothetical protein